MINELEQWKHAKLEAEIDRIAKEFTYGAQRKAVKDFVELLAAKPTKDKA